MGKLFEELLASQEELTAAQKAFNKKANDIGEDALKEAFKEVFDKHPSLYSISWRQYTPYFNDGDPCYFRVSEYEIEYVEDEDDEAAANDDQNKAAADVEKLFSDLDDDLLESILGDHIRVEVTAEGISVKEYDHD